VEVAESFADREDDAVRVDVLVPAVDFVEVGVREAVLVAAAERDEVAVLLEVLVEVADFVAKTP
jgi:hypothetical protein